MLETTDSIAPFVYYRISRACVCAHTHTQTSSFSLYSRSLPATHLSCSGALLSKMMVTRSHTLRYPDINGITEKATTRLNE